MIKKAKKYLWTTLRKWIPHISKLCNQVRSLSLFRWRTLTLLNI
jgi:hypothetical protein